MDLSSLKHAEGARHKKKRIGRGEGSGSGVTAGRGHKGYGSRSGRKKRAWFEGGQMPLQRRLPKFGFSNIFRKEIQVVNVGDLEKFKGSAEITKTMLAEKRLIRKDTEPVKILGKGDISFKTTVSADAVSKTAQEKIEKAGGNVNLS